MTSAPHSRGADDGAAIQTDAAPLAPGQSRLRVRAGETELQFEGSEAFLRELLPTVLDALVRRTGGSAPSPTPAAPEPPPGRSDAPLGALARELGIASDRVQVALRPSPEPPWIDIDPHHWAVFKDKGPKFGRNSANDVQFVAMALNLWFRQLGRDAPTMPETRSVVRAAGLTTKNATRSIENCATLQRRGEHVGLRPSEYLRARRIVRAFCLQEAVAAE